MCSSDLFGGDPAAIGTSVKINGLGYTILGVMPRGFSGTELLFTPEFWVPMAMEPQIEPGNNWLDNPEYKGVNSRWRTPEGGRFELQFHTPESLDAKENRTHRAYERLRSPETARAEQRALRTYQRLVSAAVPVPGGVEAIRRA